MLDNVVARVAGSKQKKQLAIFMDIVGSVAINAMPGLKPISIGLTGMYDSQRGWSISGVAETQLKGKGIYISLGIEKLKQDMSVSVSGWGPIKIGIVIAMPDGLDLLSLAGVAKLDPQGQLPKLLRTKLQFGNFDGDMLLRTHTTSSSSKLSVTGRRLASADEWVEQESTAGLTSSATTPGSSGLSAPRVRPGYETFSFVKYEMRLESGCVLSGTGALKDVIGTGKFRASVMGKINFSTGAFHLSVDFKGGIEISNGDFKLSAQTLTLDINRSPQSAEGALSFRIRAKMHCQLPQKLGELYLEMYGVMNQDDGDLVLYARARADVFKGVPCIMTLGAIRHKKVTHSNGSDATAKNKIFLSFWLPNGIKLENIGELGTVAGVEDAPDFEAETHLLYTNMNGVMGDISGDVLVYMVTEVQHSGAELLADAGELHGLSLIEGSEELSETDVTLQQQQNGRQKDATTYDREDIWVDEGKQRNSNTGASEPELSTDKALLKQFLGETPLGTAHAMVDVLTKYHVKVNSISRGTIAPALEALHEHAIQVNAETRELIKAVESRENIQAAAEAAAAFEEDTSGKKTGM